MSKGKLILCASLGKSSRFVIIDAIILAETVLLNMDSSNISKIFYFFEVKAVTPIPTLKEKSARNFPKNYKIFLFTGLKFIYLAMPNAGQLSTHPETFMLGKSSINLVEIIPPRL